MKAQRTLACVVVVLGLVLAWWRCTGERAATRQPTATAGQKPVPGTLGSAAEPARPAPAWFAARNASARRIAGRVTFRGAPVEGAVVSLQSVLSRAGLVPPVELRTRADGRFDFGMQAAAQFDLTASSPDTTAALVHLDLADPTLAPPSDQLELRLGECTASVEGTIYDAAGNPLPSAKVRRSGLVGVESDARGAYRLCVPRGDVELAYGAEGYGSVVLTIEARGEMHRDVVLVPEAVIVVRAVRAENGEPVAEANVIVVPAEWGPDRGASAGGITDHEGRVRIDGLLPGRYRVLGFAEGLQAQSPVEVLAEVGAANEAVLRLVATAWIRGKVVSGGKPVAGAQVVAVRKAPTQRSPAAVSQADGSFVIERVPAGELVFTASPYEVTSPPRFEAEPGKRYNDVVLEVRALGAIRGTVTRLGKPVAGAEVCCVPTLFPPRATTDGEGHYELRGVVPGAYQLGASSDEVGAFSPGTSFTLAAGEQRVVDLELDVAGTIAGTVVDKEGKPVQGVFVRWIHEKTGDFGRSMTDAQGRYRCGAMTGGGTYRAGVFSGPDLSVPYPTADGAPYPTRELADGKTVIEGVVLAIDRPQLAISGRVVDDVGEPVADAIVKALPAAPGPAPLFHSWLRLPMTSTDGDGQFTLAGLAPGNHALQARAIDGGEGMVPAVAAGTKGVSIRLERAGAIEGKLVGFAQTPSVYARGLAELRLTPGTVDGATFRIGGLRAGRYLVNAQTTYEGEAQIVEVRAGQATKVVLTAQGRAAIEGSVLDFRTRAPIAFATCRTVMAVEGEQAITTWDPSTAARSDERGRFVLDPTPAGSVSVACEMPSFRRSRPSSDLVVAAGSRASVSLLSVEVTQESPSTVGLAFNWQVTAPRVSSVQPNSPAAKAGVLVGDLVTHVNGAAVQGLNGVGVWTLIQDVPAGEDVRLAVSRAGATKAFAMKAVSGL